MNRGAFMKKYISVAVILSLIPVLGFSEHPRVTELIAQKQEKMEQLKKCKGTTKSLKIAGISTLGITAVGIGANIAEAVILNDKQDDLKEADTKLKQTQTKVDEKRKKDKEDAERLAKEKAEQEDLKAKQKAEDEKAQKQAEDKNFSSVCVQNRYNFLREEKACLIDTDPTNQSSFENITKKLNDAKESVFKEFGCKDIVYREKGHSDIPCGEYFIRYAYDTLMCPKNQKFNQALNKCATNQEIVQQKNATDKINKAFRQACKTPWKISEYSGYLGCVNGDQNKDISQDELKKALTDIKIDGCKDEIVYTSARNAYRECTGANKIMYLYKDIDCGEDKEFKRGECQEKPVDINKLHARALNGDKTCFIIDGTKGNQYDVDKKYCDGMVKNTWMAKHNNKEYKGAAVCTKKSVVYPGVSDKPDGYYCVCKFQELKPNQNVNWPHSSTMKECEQDCAASCAASVNSNRLKAN